jgi:hypothetical protein
MNTIHVYIKPLYHRKGLFLRLPETYDIYYYSRISVHLWFCGGAAAVSIERNERYFRNVYNMLNY